MRVVIAMLFVLAIATLAFATPAHAAQPTLAGSFDGSGTPARSMLPTRMAVDETSGSVYVVDPANDVVNVFDASGQYQTQLAGSATPAGTFDFASTGDDPIAVDNSPGGTRNVYVVGEDSGGPEEITAFDDSGRLLWQTAPPSGSDVCGVAVDSSGHLWTADYSGGVQQRSTTDGSTIGSAISIFGGSCHFGFEPAGSFFMILWDTGSLHEYDASGREIGPNAPTPIDPSGGRDVAIDSFNGDVYVVHPDSASRFDASGNAVGTPFATSQISNAEGIAVNGVSHQIYLSDTQSRRVFIFDETIPFTVSVTPAGAGSGSVSADSGAISDCSSSGGTCSDSYNSGTVVTLTATPAAGSSFTGWSGGGCSGTGTCQVTVSADTTVTATFDPAPRHTLSVVDGGSGSGSVTSSPAGIDCGAACSQLFEEGHVVLTAAPAAHSTFTGWSGGGCSGTSTCDVDLTADTDVTATFAQDLPAVADESATGVTQAAATLGGSVNPNGAATTCAVEWGATTAYGSTAPCATSPGSGTSAVAVSASVSGLTAGTAYHYRVDATNAGGTTSGADQTFTTAAAPTCATDASLCPPPPTCATDASLCVRSPLPTCATDASLCPRTTPTLPKRATIVGTSARIVLRCKAGGSSCSGTLTLRARVTVKRGRRRVVKTIVVGTARYRLSRGSSATVKVKLSAAALSALAHGSLRATARGLHGSVTLPRRPSRKR